METEPQTRYSGERYPAATRPIALQVPADYVLSPDQLDHAVNEASYPDGTYSLAVLLDALREAILYIR